LRNSNADTLTAMDPIGKPAATHAWACLHASRTTQAPIGTIRPESSATGINCAGGTDPRVGCVQRSSASAPVIARVVRLIFG
jgi:hypothetical protein